MDSDTAFRKVNCFDFIRVGCCGSRANWLNCRLKSITSVISGAGCRLGVRGGNWYPEQGASEARATCWAGTSSNVQDFASRQDVLQSSSRQRVRLLRRLLKSGELTNPWIGGPTVASAIDMRQKWVPPRTCTAKKSLSYWCPGLIYKYLKNS